MWRLPSWICWWVRRLLFVANPSQQSWHKYGFSYGFACWTFCGIILSDSSCICQLCRDSVFSSQSLLLSSTRTAVNFWHRRRCLIQVAEAFELFITLITSVWIYTVVIHHMTPQTNSKIERLTTFRACVWRVTDGMQLYVPPYAAARHKFLTTFRTQIRLGSSRARFYTLVLSEVAKSFELLATLVTRIWIDARVADHMAPQAHCQVKLLAAFRARKSWLLVHAHATSKRDVRGKCLSTVRAGIWLNRCHDIQACGLRKFAVHMCHIPCSFSSCIIIINSSTQENNN